MTDGANEQQETMPDQPANQPKRGGRWALDHPRWRLLSDPKWGFLGVILTIAAIVLAILIANGLFTSQTQALLRPGQVGESGPLLVTLTSIKCGYSSNTLPEGLGRSLPPSLPGQLCLAFARVKNESSNENSAFLRALLYVGSATYDSISQFYHKGAPGFPAPLAPVLFPGTQASMAYVFQLPSAVIPTRLSFQAGTSAATVVYNIEESV
jgi:hypothetical protein